MKALTLLLYRWLLPKILKVKTDHRIPRSGIEGKKVNCFGLHFDNEDSPYFLAEGITDCRIDGLKWSKSSYSEKGSLSIYELHNHKFKLTHFYGLYDVKFSSIHNYAFHYITKFIYIKLNIIRFIESTSQFFFNKKRLVTVKRMDLLQVMLNDQMDREHKGISIINLMTLLYTHKWLFHPERDSQRDLLKIYLDSLVESGELRVTNLQYEVTGKAISTLEKFEESEQRHVSSVKIQRRMFWLTIILVLIGIVQAGIVKPPVLLDFSKQATVQEPHNK